MHTPPSLFNRGGGFQKGGVPYKKVAGYIDKRWWHHKTTKTQLIGCL